MRYFEYHHHNSSVIELARESYSWLFDRGYSLESIEVRYYLLEYLRETFGYV